MKRKLYFMLLAFVAIAFLPSCMPDDETTYSDDDTSSTSNATITTAGGVS